MALSDSEAIGSISMRSELLDPCRRLGGRVGTLLRARLGRRWGRLAAGGNLQGGGWEGGKGMGWGECVIGSDQI